MTKEKNFYACKISNRNLDEVRQANIKKGLVTSDMFNILLHNQTILNEKLNKLLK